MLLLTVGIIGFAWASEEETFMSWFLGVFALQFAFLWIGEVLAMWFVFSRRWRRDQKMVREDVFVEYYLSFRDYEEWTAHKRKQRKGEMDEEEQLLEEPLLGVRVG